MGNCQTDCGCNEREEKKGEFQIDEPESNITRAERKKLSRDYTDQYYMENEEKIVTIQSRWRGVLARKYTTRQKDQRNYFSLTEASELRPSNTPFDPSLKREKKPKFVFKSGASYEGEWKGRFRDGHGLQQWPDGAQYEGVWVADRA